MTVIKNGKLLVSGENGFEIKSADVAIEDGKISNIGNITQAEYENAETFNAGGKLVMPGLINMHTHAYMNFMKGCADDVVFNEWLFNRIFPIEDRMEKEDAYWGTLLGCIEMISTGTTSFTDMHITGGMGARAVKECGMRAFIGRGLVGESLETDGKSRFEEALKETEEFSSDLIEFLISPHAIYTCSETLLRELNEEAKKRKSLKQIHLSESDFEFEQCLKERGKTPTQYLNDMGFLDDRTILAHCVKLTDEDIEIIKNSGASVVTNPASNAKLGNGMARVCKMLQTGVNLCLGTDGSASNNTLNMFREMNLLTLMHKAGSGDPTAVSSKETICAATLNAAKAVRREGQLGVIREGANADLIFIDLNSPSLFPNHDIPASLCYCANGSEVESVMVAGRFLMKNRELLTIDKEKVYFEINRIVKRLF